MNRNTKLTAEHQNNQLSVTWQSCITAQTKKIKSPDPIMYSFYRGTIESILSSCITVCMAPAPFSAARTCSVLWEQLWRSLMSLFCPYWTFTTPAPPEKPPGLQVSLPISQSLQSAAAGEETAESPGQNQQAQRQFLPPGTPNAQLPPCSGPTLPCASTAPHHWLWAMNSAHEH